MSSNLRQTAYVFALNQSRGLGPRLIAQVLARFPTPESLLSASPGLVRNELKENVWRILDASLLSRWETIISSASESVARHLEKNITPLPITDNCYPPLLKLIPDPPPVLFVRGNVELVCSSHNIAIVGTRKATEGGKAVAVRIARYFGSQGYVVISGLAKGIDAVAHQGALNAGAKTIAVLGTPVDQIYPAENRPLAEQILERSGALISELPIGHKPFRNAFVQRDRIQSGLSIAVVPVQTDMVGGTMHTVKFAEAQGRLLFCPRPLVSDQMLAQYAGIIELIRSRRARGFQAEDYGSILAALSAHRRKLLTETSCAPPQPVTTSQAHTAADTGGASQKNISESPQQAFGFAKRNDLQPAEISDDHVTKMVALSRELGLDKSTKDFDHALRRVRRKIFGRERGRPVFGKTPLPRNGH